MSEAAPEVTEEPQEPAMGGGDEEPRPNGPDGYPLNTKPSEMTPEQQAAYYKYQARRTGDINKTNAARLRELEAKAAQWDALDEASKTEQQRELDRLTRELEAARKASDDQRRQFGSQLVETKLAAAAAGKGMTPDALKTLAGDLSRFLADGGVDDEQLDAFLGALPDVKQQAPLQPASLGGGRRSPAAAPSGAELYRQMHPKRTSATS